jgi:hypothetical protein
MYEIWKQITKFLIDAYRSKCTTKVYFINLSLTYGWSSSQYFTRGDVRPEKKKWLIPKQL